MRDAATRMIRVLRGVSGAVGRVPGDLRQGARAWWGRAADGNATRIPRPDNGERLEIAADLAKLEDAMSTQESRHAGDIALVHADHHADAVNLTHYLALRQGDERSLQRSLGERGLSSLGRCEPHVLATVESVRAALDSTLSVPVPPDLSFEAGRAALDRNTDALFGPRPQGRVPRVMVTLPSEAATDYQLVRTSCRRAWTSRGSTAPTTAPTNGSRWPATSARRPMKCLARAGSPWTCPGQRCAPDPSEGVREWSGSGRGGTSGAWRSHPTG